MIHESEESAREHNERLEAEVARQKREFAKQGVDASDLDVSDMPARKATIKR